MNRNHFYVFPLEFPAAGVVPAVFDNDGKLLLGFEQICENLALGDTKHVTKFLEPAGVKVIPIELPVVTEEGDDSSYTILMECIDSKNLYRCLTMANDINLKNGKKNV